MLLHLTLEGHVVPSGAPAPNDPPGTLERVGVVYALALAADPEHGGFAAVVDAGAPTPW